MYLNLNSTYEKKKYTLKISKMNVKNKHDRNVYINIYSNLHTHNAHVETKLNVRLKRN